MNFKAQCATASDRIDDLLLVARGGAGRGRKAAKIAWRFARMTEKRMRFICAKYIAFLENNSQNLKSHILLRYYLMLYLKAKLRKNYINV